jgi:hypothetical protein
MQFLTRVSATCRSCNSNTRNNGGAPGGGSGSPLRGGKSTFFEGGWGALGARWQVRRSGRTGPCHRLVLHLLRAGQRRPVGRRPRGEFPDRLHIAHICLAGAHGPGPSRPGAHRTGARLQLHALAPAAGGAHHKVAQAGCAPAWGYNASDKRLALLDAGRLRLPAWARPQPVLPLCCSLTCGPIRRTWRYRT